MKCSLLSIFLLVFVLNPPVPVLAKGGRGGGGGRGSSGARSSGGSRSTYTTGSSNFRSSTNTQYNSNFRSGMFHSSTTSTYFVSSPMLHTHVIISPYTPMVYGGYNYYWGGHYVQNQERPLQCEYEITDSDEELRNVTFSNGTSPKTISFGCRGSEKCCGMECCSESTNLWVIIVVVGVVLIYVTCRRCNQNGFCEPKPSVVVGVPVITSTTTTTSYNVPPNNGPFPGNNGPQFDGPPPPGPPGYHPSPRQSNFEQHPPPSAPYENRPMSTSQIKTGMRY